jgi:hypothetical protein
MAPFLGGGLFQENTFEEVTADLTNEKVLPAVKIILPNKPHGDSTYDLIVFAFTGSDKLPGDATVRPSRPERHRPRRYPTCL